MGFESVENGGIPSNEDGTMNPLQASQLLTDEYSAKILLATLPDRTFLTRFRSAFA